MDDNTFAGLPAGALPNAAPATPAAAPTVAIPRYRTRYRIPRDVVNPDFFKTFSESDLTFELCELSLEDQDHCAKNANGNASVMTRLLVFASVVKVGKGKEARTLYRQYEPVEEWYRAMGRRGNRLVQDAFTEKHSVPEGVTQMFLAGAEPVVD